jgi:hypothetical protein
MQERKEESEYEERERDGDCTIDGSIGGAVAYAISGTGRLEIEVDIIGVAPR